MLRKLSQLATGNWRGWTLDPGNFGGWHGTGGEPGKSWLEPSLGGPIVDEPIIHAYTNLEVSTFLYVVHRDVEKKPGRLPIEALRERAEVIIC